MAQNNTKLSRRSFLASLLSYVTILPKINPLLLHKTQKLDIGDIVSYSWICDDELSDTFGQKIEYIGVIVGKINGFMPNSIEQLPETCFYVEYLDQSVSEPDSYWESELTLVYRKET